MAWSVPRTWVTSETITSSIMNTHVRDELNYLKNTVTSAQPARALDTTYQNGASIRLVSATLRLTSSNASGVQLDAYVSATSTPSTGGTLVAELLNNFSSTGSLLLWENLVMLVPASYYYRIVTTAAGPSTPAVITWNESDLH